MGEFSRIEPFVERWHECGAEILSLYRKLSKKLETGRGIQLSQHDLNILAEVGILERLAGLATDYQVRKCQERNARNRSISVASTAFVGEMTGQTSKSSGTMSKALANEVLAQAQAMLGKHASP